MSKLTEAIQQRIDELYEADNAFCKDRWDMKLPDVMRSLARENSNQVTFARQELQTILKKVEEFEKESLPVKQINLTDMLAELEGERYNVEFSNSLNMARIRVTHDATNINKSSTFPVDHHLNLDKVLNVIKWSKIELLKCIEQFDKD